MKKYWSAFVMCQSMFCAVPCPWKAWDEKARSVQLMFLPLIGLEIGVLWTGLYLLTDILNLNSFITGIVLCAYPYVVTGFLHLDGFMDVTDAVKSWRSLERRREILKDSRVGSFAVISVILLILAQFAFSATVPEAGVSALAFVFVPVVSRCCSVLAIKVLPPMETSQYAEHKSPACHIAVTAVILAAAVVLSFVLCGADGAATLGCILGYALALIRAYRSLEGMNGDISGYALSIGELCGIAALVLI